MRALAINSTFRDKPSRWLCAASLIALLLALALLGNTRFVDGLRSASYFLRTRKGPVISPVISTVRIDREFELTREYAHVFIRTRC